MLMTHIGDRYQSCGDPWNYTQAGTNILKPATWAAPADLTKLAVTNKKKSLALQTFPYELIELKNYLA